MSSPDPAATLRLWHVPVTVVEYHRVAVVEAATKAEAHYKARQALWEHMDGEARSFKVTVCGPATEVDEVHRG